MIILGILMFLLALGGMVLFQQSLIAGIPMALCAAALLAVRLFFSKKIKKPIAALVYAGCSVVFVLCAMFGGGRASDYGMTAYSKAYNTAADAYNEGDYRTAVEAVEKMETELGQTDAATLLKVEALLEGGDAGAAVEALRQMQDKDSVEYYLHLAAYYDQVDDYEALKRTVMEGVEKNPQSLRLNHKAGCLAANDGEYTKAHYYLERAFELAPAGNYFVPYELARLGYETQDAREAYAYMIVAEYNGILEDEELVNAPVVQWYLEVKEAFSNEQEE